MLALIAAPSIAADQMPRWIRCILISTQTGGRYMHLHLYRDESRSGHFDLVGEGDHPWTIDLVTVTQQPSWWWASPAL